MIFKILSESDWRGVEFVGVGVESESKIRDSAHLYQVLPFSRLCRKNSRLLRKPKRLEKNIFLPFIGNRNAPKVGRNNTITGRFASPDRALVKPGS